VGYFSDHQQQIAGGWPGLLVLGEDFGEGGPMPPVEDHKQIALDHAYEALRVLDEARYRTRAVDNDKAWDDIGSVADYIRDIAEARLPNLDNRPFEPGPGPGPGPEPLPPAHLFTSRVHWDGSPAAVDVYGLPRGAPIVLGVDVHVTGSGQITPLTDAVEYSALVDGGWQIDTYAIRGGGPRICMETFGETMFILHLRALRTNRTYRILHVLKEAPLGQNVPAGQPVGYWGDSGIAGLGDHCTPPPDVTHLHIEGDGMTGLQACQELGLVIGELVPAIPSPQHYQACQATGGRFV
jgi:hypothetical protein